MSMHCLTLLLICLTSLMVGVCGPARAEEPRSNFLEYAQSLYDYDTGVIDLVQAEEVRQPAEFGADSGSNLTSLRSESPPAQATTAAPVADRANITETLKPSLATSTPASFSAPAQVEASQQITQRVDTGVATAAPVSVVPASTFSLASQPDVAETIAEVSTTPTVKTQRRSPIAMDPRIRGYRGGQIYTMMDGAYLTPVRTDLDAILTKVDQSLIGSTQVISGPYGLRFGSGFSFLNVDSIPTPRYEDGREHHLRLGTKVRPNGGQTYNTVTALGGGEVGGYYVNLGYRKGDDYTAGDGLEIPSSYGALNLFSAYGRDLGENTEMVTKFSLLDQGQTEYAGQFFDVDDLKHYGITHSFIHANEETGFGWRIDGWYSNTNFNGDTDLAGKRRFDFPVLQRVDQALFNAMPASPGNSQFRGDVEGELTTTGFRAGMTNDPDNGITWGVGTDLRFIQQEIDEFYDISDFGFADPLFQTGLPTAEVFDPGLYLEFTVDVHEFWTVASGSRIAFASTQADGADLGPTSNFKNAGGDIIRDLDVSDTLLSFYLTNDLQLTDACSARVGAGYAERLPDLTDRYSDGLFLATIQSGFSRVIGNPELKKERNWQVDARLDASYENIRGNIGGFHAWITDYNTYAANPIADPLGARLLQAVNTDLATLAGFESYVEMDLLDGLQTFGGLSYLDGRDQEISQPLSGIFPLEGRIGMRLQDSTPDNSWGVEWGWRIVDNQDRLASLRPVNGAGPPIALETETPGFATSYLRGYMRPSDRVSITAGAQNLFDRDYYEHLNLRIPADANFAETVVLAPGFMPYFGVEVDY